MRLPAMSKAVPTLVLLFALPGCMFGSKYQRPPVATPESWRFEESEAKAVANTAWWEQFNDPALTDLIHTALRENKDVRIAAGRIEEFLGQYATVRAALFPQIGANFDASRSLNVPGVLPTPTTPSIPITNPAARAARAAGKAPRPSRQAPSSGSTSSSEPKPGSSYLAFLNAGWQIDLFGKLQWATEAARAGLLSTEESRRGVILTLVASVANAYMELRSLDRQLEITETTAKSRKGTYDLFKLRFDKGVISELELYQSESEVESALATIPILRKAIAQQENALSILLGRNPGPIPRGKPFDELALPVLPSGLPLSLLANRPDVRQAEQDLISTHAQVGLARSLYYPTLSLSGFLGSSTTEVSKLFSGPARMWDYGGSVTAPVFAGGAIAGQVRTAKAVHQEMGVRFEQVVQSALREVEDALVDQKMTRQEVEALTRQVNALRNAAHFARLRFDNGQTSFIEVLDAERSLFAAELFLVETRGTQFQALVNLYKAMGGGWVAEAEKLAPPAGKKVDGGQ